MFQGASVSARLSDSHRLRGWGAMCYERSAVALELVFLLLLVRGGMAALRQYYSRHPGAEADEFLMAIGSVAAFNRPTTVL